MPHMLHEVTIEAAPEKVFAALTEEAGLKGWWTNRVSAEPTPGSVAEFGFYGGQAVFKLSIDELQANSRLKWNVQQGMPDGSWDGTHMTWDLAAAEGGTKVTFAHRDFPSYEGSFATVNYNWGWFLTSLKQYVETGTGNPAVS